MRRIRLPKDINKWKGTHIAIGERAIVKKVTMSGHEAHGLVKRVSRGYPARQQNSSEVMFHQHKLAKKLFPSNFIEVVGVEPARELIHGSILFSKKVKLDRLSRKVLKIYYDNRGRINDMQKVYSNPDYIGHINRVNDIALPIVRKMREEGIYVNTNPANVWFTTKGIPVFFDVTWVDTQKLVSRWPLLFKGKTDKASIKFLMKHQKNPG